jgi:hypothetical protein
MDLNITGSKLGYVLWGTYLINVPPCSTGWCLVPKISFVVGKVTFKHFTQRKRRIPNPAIVNGILLSTDLLSVACL